MEQRTTACAFDKTEVYGRTIRVSEKLSAQAQMYPPTTFDTEPVGYTAPRAYDPQVIFLLRLLLRETNFPSRRLSHCPNFHFYSAVARVSWATLFLVGVYKKLEWEIP